MKFGPQTQFAQRLHAQKYRMPGETYEQFVDRLSDSVSTDGLHYVKLREIFQDQFFLPGGRIQAAMGTGRDVTAFNCYVSGTIADSMVSGRNSIMEIAKDAATTMRMGGGIGYDFSTIRPKSELIKKLGSQASGPVSFMQIFNAVCNCIASAGHRRGAQMGVLRIDHPDIEEFISAKQNGDSLNGFNISIAVTDEFMNCLENGKSFPLKWNNKIYSHIDPKFLWNKIMESTWDWAEPGILFIDRINDMNNLHYCETIAATNPCGEQPLPPHGACLLGSFNLTKYITGEAGFSLEFDFNLLQKHIPVVVEAMDNVIDRTKYPLEEQEAEALSKRRMGIGVTGLANALEALGMEYGSDDFVRMSEEIMYTLTVGCYEASAELAKTKGSFPLYKEAKYMSGLFVRSLPKATRNKIKQYGIRNSHLISVAPTGTISMCADNISSGIEPVFSLTQERTIQTETGAIDVTLQDYGLMQFGVEGKTVDKVSVMEHLRVLTAVQKYCDSAVSKTCNVSDDVTFEEFVEIYRQAYLMGAKGCTTFRMAGKRMGILKAKSKEELEEESCSFDPVTGQGTCS